MTVFLPEGRDASRRAPVLPPAKLERRQTGHAILTSPPPYLAPDRYPGAISQASPWMALAAVLHIRLHILNVSLALPGMLFTDLLVRMGVRIHEEVTSPGALEPSGNLDIRSANLRGLAVCSSLAKSLPHELAIIAVLATASKGNTTILGWKQDEDDLEISLCQTCENLRQMQASIEVFHEGLHVTGPSSLRGADLQTGGDPRLASAFSIAALLAQGESIIRDIAPGSIPFQSTWPDHFIEIG